MRNCLTQILFSNIIPRGEYDLDIKQQEFNLKMLQKSEEFNFKVNDNSNLPSRGNIIEKFFASDKIHLSEIGTKIFANNISQCLRVQFNIPLKTSRLSDKPMWRTSGFRNSNRRSMNNYQDRRYGFQEGNVFYQDQRYGPQEGNDFYQHRRNGPQEGNGFIRIEDMDPKRGMTLSGSKIWTPRKPIISNG